MVDGTYGDLETLVSEDERSVSGGKIAVHRIQNFPKDVDEWLDRCILRMLLYLCVVDGDELTRKPF